MRLSFLLCSPQAACFPSQSQIPGVSEVKCRTDHWQLPRGQLWQCGEERQAGAAGPWSLSVLCGSGVPAAFGVFFGCLLRGLYSRPYNPCPFVRGIKAQCVIFLHADIQLSSSSCSKKIQVLIELPRHLCQKPLDRTCKSSFPGLPFHSVVLCVFLYIDIILCWWCFFFFLNNLVSTIYFVMFFQILYVLGYVICKQIILQLWYFFFFLFLTLLPWLELQILCQTEVVKADIYFILCSLFWILEKSYRPLSLMFAVGFICSFYRVLSSFPNLLTFKSWVSVGFCQVLFLHRLSWQYEAGSFLLLIRVVIANPLLLIIRTWLNKPSLYSRSQPNLVMVYNPFSLGGIKLSLLIFY